MFYVYIIYSESNHRFYTGQTKDILKRLCRHNSNKVNSTAGRGPWKIIFSMQFKTRRMAVEAEKKIKSRGASRFLDSLR